MTNTDFVDNNGTVHHLSDYETFDEWFDAWLESLPTEENDTCITDIITNGGY